MCVRVYIYIYIRRVLHYALADTYIRSIRTIFFGVVSIAQLIEVTDSAVLGGVIEVVSSIPTVGHKIVFSISRHS